MGKKENFKTASLLVEDAATALGVALMKKGWAAKKIGDMLTEGKKKKGMYRIVSNCSRVAIEISAGGRKGGSGIRNAEFISTEDIRTRTSAVMLTISMEEEVDEENDYLIGMCISQIVEIERSNNLHSREKKRLVEEIKKLLPAPALSRVERAELFHKKINNTITTWNLY